MNRIRRKFLLTAGATGMALTLGPISHASDEIAPLRPRRFKFVHIDVFTLQPLLGNPLDVFLDARGMSDAEMLAVTRETYLNEATFVFPRDPATEREHGISVRIFTPDGEVPFAGTRRWELPRCCETCAWRRSLQALRRQRALLRSPST